MNISGISYPIVSSASNTKNTNHSIFTNQQQNPITKNTQTALGECSRNLFLANLNLNKTSFKANPEAIAAQDLKRSLSSICQDTICAYNSGNEKVKWSDFTRCFVHHCFDFSQDEGDDVHKYLFDPLGTNVWGSYQVSKKRIGGIGKSIEEMTLQRMNEHIPTWTNKFLKIIKEEETNNKNQLYSSLLKNAKDTDKLKEQLGIQI